MERHWGLWWAILTILLPRAYYCTLNTGGERKAMLPASFPGERTVAHSTQGV